MFSVLVQEKKNLHLVTVIIRDTIHPREAFYNINETLALKVLNFIWECNLSYIFFILVHSDSLLMVYDITSHPIREVTLRKRKVEHRIFSDLHFF